MPFKNANSVAEKAPKIVFIEEMALLLILNESIEFF